MVRFVTWLTHNQQEFNVYAPGSILSCLDVGLPTILQVPSSIRIPRHIQKLADLKIIRSAIEDWPTTNFHIPRYLQLPDLLKEHNNVHILDLDSVVLRPLEPGNHFMFWGDGNFRYWDDYKNQHENSWWVYGTRILGGCASFEGDVGLAFAETIKEEIEKFTQQEVDKHLADQMAIWRTWSQRGPWPTVRCQKSAVFGVPPEITVPSDQHFVHPQHRNWPIQWWLDYTMEYQRRWFGKKRVTKLKGIAGQWQSDKFWRKKQK